MKFTSNCTSRMTLGINIAALLAALPTCALADTIYKCVHAGGQISFSSQPCDGKTIQTSQLSVPPPEADDVSAARLAKESARLRLADKHFAARQAARDAALGRRVGSQIANLPLRKAAGQSAKPVGQAPAAAVLSAPPHEKSLQKDSRAADSGKLSPLTYSHQGDAHVVGKNSGSPGRRPNRSH
jgi:hypothetical protein